MEQSLLFCVHKKCWTLKCLSSDNEVAGGWKTAWKSTTNATAHASVNHAEPILTDAVHSVPRTQEFTESKPSTFPKPLLGSADEQTTRPNPSSRNAVSPVQDKSKLATSKSTKVQLFSNVLQDGQSVIHGSGDANGATRRSPYQTLNVPHSSRLLDETESEDDDIFTEARRIVSKHKSLEESISSRSNPSTKPSLSNRSSLVVDVENSIEEVGAERAKETSISENGPVRKVPQLGDIQKAQANLEKSSIKESGVQPVPKLEKEIRREHISKGTIGRNVEELPNTATDNDHGSTCIVKNENSSPAVDVGKQTQETRKISEAPKKSLFDSDNDSDSELFTVVRRPIQHPVHVAPPSSQNTTTAKPSVERGGQQGTDQPLLKPQTATAKSASGNVSPAAPMKESESAPKKKGLFDSDNSDLDELFSTSKEMSSDQHVAGGTGGSQISRESTASSTAHASVNHADSILTNAVHSVPKTHEFTESKPSTFPKPLLGSADEQTTRPNPSSRNAVSPVQDKSKLATSKSTKVQLFSNVLQDGQSVIHASGDANGATRRSPYQTLNVPHSSRLLDETESEDDYIFTEARRVVSHPTCPKQVLEKSTQVDHSHFCSDGSIVTKYRLRFGTNLWVTQPKATQFKKKPMLSMTESECVVGFPTDSDLEKMKASLSMTKTVSVCVAPNSSSEGPRVVRACGRNVPYLTFSEALLYLEMKNSKRPIC